MFIKMEFESEIDALVGLARVTGKEKNPSHALGNYEMALKRFQKDFPTPEAQQAYVETFLKWTSQEVLEVLSDEEQIREAFRYWFKVIWPNLPALRGHPLYFRFQSSASTPLYSVGSVVVHRRFEYRGVIAGLDRKFQGTREWYEKSARSMPPKNRPWYRVLVDGSQSVTYVAERHIELDPEPQPVSHPLIDQFFVRFQDGKYFTR